MPPAARPNVADMSPAGAPLIGYHDARSAALALHASAQAIGATEFAQVRNLGYVASPHTMYPLAPRATPPLPHVAAFAVDMDGTSTTTEPLALHALEYMVRRFTGLRSRAEWAGLDEQRDHPHVIGNSNFRHAEFLLERYGDRLRPEALRAAFFESLVWTLSNMRDEQRRGEIRRTARQCGLDALLDDADFVALVSRGPISETEVARAIESPLARFGPAFRLDHAGARTAAALDVYYMRYHAMLARIARGESDAVAREVFGDGPVGGLIEPMPAYDVFLPLVKGWLGEEAGLLCEPLRQALRPGGASAGEPLERSRARLASLGRTFERSPARLALVTASIAYEAHAVMKEVVRVIAQRCLSWPISAARRERIAAGLSDYRRVFDGFVNASDAHEARLKPHPDLYSIALFQMSIPREQYGHVVGLEDTEPGVVSLRAAGIGCAVALPNRDTTGQDYRAAAEVVRGGLPELILARNLLLADESRSAG